MCSLFRVQKRILGSIQLFQIYIRLFVQKDLSKISQICDFECLDKKDSLQSSYLSMWSSQNHLVAFLLSHFEKWSQNWFLVLRFPKTITTEIIQIAILLHFFVKYSTNLRHFWVFCAIFTKQPHTFSTLPTLLLPFVPRIDYSARAPPFGVCSLVP